MNPPVPNELISAYFDGEGSPDERAAVESLLDESIATRRELDEISQLSALLHSFPRESAPAELVANVRRQTDQMPLVVPVAAASAVSPRSLRREWTAAALGALVTAASLMLMTNLVDQPGSRDAKPWTGQTAPAKPDGVVSREEFAMTPAATDGIHAGGDRPLAGKDAGAGASFKSAAAPESEALSTPTLASKSAAAMTPSDNSVESLVRGGGNSALKSAPGGGDPFFEAQQSRNMATNLMLLDNSFTGNSGTLMLSNIDFLGGLKVGQVIEFVPQVADPENNVAVVDLQVLDIEKGVNQVQVLLSKYSIRPRHPGQMTDRDKQKFEKLAEESKSGSNEIVAVYTYGPGEKLAQTLEDLANDRELFVSWSSQHPVQLSNSGEWADLNTDKSSAKDAAAPADQPTRAKQLAAQTKESAADDDMDSEAKLALQTVLARGVYSNNGFNNYTDVNTVNGPQEQAGNSSKTGRTFGNQASRARAADSKSQLAEPKNAPPATAPAPSTANNAKKGADPKSDVAAKPDPTEQSSGYLVLRKPSDAPVALEQAVPLTRSQGQNLDRSQNTTRRYTANLGVPQTDVNANSRVDANQAVKVLFVLHSAQAQTAVPAAAAPSGKPNP